MGRCTTLGLLLAIPISLAVLAGCNEPRDCGGVDASFDQLTTTASGFPLFTGDVTVELPPPQLSLCPTGFTYPVAIAVRVFDPGERPLVVSWEPVHGRRVRAGFHSDAPGLHRVEVDYAPDRRTGRGLTTVTSVATLMLGRNGAPRMELGARCDDLRRTAQGTWLCDHEVFRGTTRVQALRPDMKYTVSGSTVWGVSEDARDGSGVWTSVRAVARWRDTGSGPLLDAGTGTFDAGQESLHSLAATNEELVVRFNYRLTQLGWTAGSSPSLRVVGQSTLPPPANALARELMTWEPPLIAFSVNDSRPGAGFGVCLYALDAGTVVPTGGCLPDPDEKTADGYWSLSRDEVTLDVLQGGAFRRVATLPTPQWWRTTYRPPAPAPALASYSGDPDRPGTVAMIPAVQPGGLAFEGYTAGANELAGVERDYFWWHQLDGGTEVVFR